MTDIVPYWLEILFQGVVIFSVLSASAVTLSKAGKSPYYALFWLIPVVQIVLIWIFAFQKWPNVTEDHD